jgi:hypothetical protein
MMELIKVLQVTHVQDTTLAIVFTSGEAGQRDFAAMLAGPGQMLEPLRDPAMFSRAFVQNGVVCWPSGYDIDAVALHATMKAAGELVQPSDAAA